MTLCKTRNPLVQKMVQWCPNLVLREINSEIFTPPFVSVLCVDCQYSLRCTFTNQGKFKMNMDSLSCRSQTLKEPRKRHLYLSNASMLSPWSPLLCMLIKNKHRITCLIFTLTIKYQESVREKMPWRGSYCTVSVILYLPFSEELLHLEMVDLAGVK